MTLLGLQDGADFKDGHSYLDLAGLLIQNGQNVAENLRELWTRMLFNILVSNTDDHLRNHGGQISFPGGRAEEADADAVATALRYLANTVPVGSTEQPAVFYDRRAATKNKSTLHFTVSETHLDQFQEIVDNPRNPSGGYNPKQLLSMPHEKTA